MNSNRFLILIFQMYIILKLYDLINYFTGAGFKVYLIILITILYFLNWFVGSYDLGRNIPSTVYYKLSIKYTKTGMSKDYFWYAVVAMIISFSIGHYYENFISYLLMTGLLIVGFNVKSALKFIPYSAAFGFFLVTPIANSLYLVFIVIIGNALIYISSDANRF